MAYYLDEAKSSAQRADRRLTNETASFTLVSATEGCPQHYRHQELWFEDGNVLIITGETWFKLYRGILSMLSGTFRDMFQLADSSAGPTVGSCPTVNVTDSPVDLALFFAALCHAGTQYVDPKPVDYCQCITRSFPLYSPLFAYPTQLIDFRDLRKIANLALIYDVPHIQAAIHHRLQVCFPSSLDQWDKQYPLSCSPIEFYSDTVRLQPIDIVGVINLARRCDTQDLLPAAFYMCSQLPVLDIMATVCYGEGDTEQLTPEDMARCLHGVEAFSGHTMIPGFDYIKYDVTTQSCSGVTADHCVNAWTKICTAYTDSFWDHSRDILYEMMKWIETVEAAGDLCDGCSRIIKQDEQELRRLRWDELSSVFGLDITLY